MNGNNKIIQWLIEYFITFIWLIYWLVIWLIHWSFACLTNWLTDCPNDWLIDWLIDEDDDDLWWLSTISSSASFRSDKFDIETKDLGKLTAVNIRHDNSWFGSAWYLEKVRRLSFIVDLNSIYLSYLQKCIFSGLLCNTFLGPII